MTGLSFKGTSLSLCIVLYKLAHFAVLKVGNLAEHDMAASFEGWMVINLREINECIPSNIVYELCSNNFYAVLVKNLI